MDTWVVTAVSMSAFALHSQLRSALIFNNTKKKIQAILVNIVAFG